MANGHPSKNFFLVRDSATETIPPIVISKTLKVFELKAVSHNETSFAPKGARGKGEKSGVRDHSVRRQLRAEENTCPVQLPYYVKAFCGGSSFVGNPKPR